MRRTRSTLILLSVLVVPPLVGQDIKPGQRVRLITTTEAASRVGRVDSITATRVWLHSSQGVAGAIELADVRTAEVSRRRRPTLGKGLVLGTLGGAALGTVLYYAFGRGQRLAGGRGAMEGRTAGGRALNGGLIEIRQCQPAASLN